MNDLYLQTKVISDHVIINFYKYFLSIFLFFLALKQTRAVRDRGFLVQMDQNNENDEYEDDEILTEVVSYEVNEVNFLKAMNNSKFAIEMAKKHKWVIANKKDHLTIMTYFKNLLDLMSNNKNQEVKVDVGRPVQSLEILFPISSTELIKLYPEFNFEMTKEDWKNFSKGSKCISQMAPSGLIEHGNYLNMKSGTRLEEDKFPWKIDKMYSIVDYFVLSYLEKKLKESNTSEERNEIIKLERMMLHAHAFLQRERFNNYLGAVAQKAGIPKSALVISEPSAYPRGMKKKEEEILKEKLEICYKLEKEKKVIKEGNYQGRQYYKKKQYYQPKQQYQQKPKAQATKPGSKS
jgi:hypothetical protein